MKSAEELRELNKKRIIDQVCYVTDDYKRTIRYFVEKLNVGPWFILANSKNCTSQVKMNGELVEEPWKFYIAHAKIGGMTIEVIQPESGPNPYSEFLEKKGPGIHHIKESIYDGDDKLQEFVDEMMEKGHKMHYEGHYMEDIYYYLDLNEELGSDYEIGNSAVCSGHPEFIGYYPEDK